MTELPDLDRLARQLAGCGVVIGVAVGEEPAHAAAFVRQYGLAFPQLVDQGYRVADALKQSRIPATFVLDRRGAIVHAGLALDQAALDALRTTVRGLDCYLTALPGA
jgi:peroxiredoxin